MTDPAVAYLPNSDYGTFDRGNEADVWLKAENGSDFLGVVWPGKYTSSVFHACWLMSLLRCDRLSW